VQGRVLWRAFADRAAGPGRATWRAAGAAARPARRFPAARRLVPDRTSRVTGRPAGGYAGTVPQPVDRRPRGLRPARNAAARGLASEPHRPTGAFTASAPSAWCFSCSAWDWKAMAETSHACHDQVGSP